MADLKLTIGGDASGATQALREVSKETTNLSEATTKSAESVGASVLKWELLREGVTKLVEVGRESLKLYAEQERADKQLSLSAGKLTSVFLEQADAIEKATGMDAVATEKMQGMLLTFGVAPGEIKKTVDALLDYSARTGEDGVAATEKLLKSVESGRSSFKGLNLQMGDTSTEAQRMRGFVEALGAKFGGSLAADSETLAGRTRIAAAAFEDMQKSFGSMLNEMKNAAVKSGVLDNLSMVFQFWRNALTGGAKDNMAALRDEAALIKSTLDGYAAMSDEARTKLYGNMPEGAKSPAELQARLKEIRGIMAAENQKAAAENERQREEAGRLAAGGSLSETAKDADKKALEEEKKRAQERTRLRMEMAAEENERNRKNDEYRLKLAQKQREEDEQEAKDAAKRALEQQRKLAEEMEREAVRDAEKAKLMGEALGNALLNGVTSALNQAQSGGEVDIGAILTSILATAVTAAMLSNPATMPFAAAAGALVGAGGNALMKAGKRHEGGWIEAPRYHSGAWVGADEQPAILQNGERVLSRAEVRGMGGPAGVDAAARGGAGASVTVQTFDGQTTRDFFERAGGRALLNAVRTGRGAPALLFGGG